MIKSCCQRDQVISYDKPQMQAVLEVRPRMRGATTPAAPALTPPVVMTSIELRPVTLGAKAPAPSSPDPRPAQTSAKELRPIMKKAEEE
jgi:hypothetical protein